MQRVVVRYSPLSEDFRKEWARPLDDRAARGPNVAEIEKV